MKVIYDKDKQNIPIKLWLDDMEENTMEQALNLARLPFVFKHIAIMPDSHLGYGMPIGGVMATKGVVVPNAVGVDIGCGMCAVKTSLTTKDLTLDILKKIMSEIRKVVPVGNNVGGRNKEKQSGMLMPAVGINIDERRHTIYHQQYESALTQIGTLGGGNHFIEIQKDTEDSIWIMIHSGSRNLGFKVAKYYNDLAIKMNKRWYSCVPKEVELAFLPVNTPEYEEYMAEMKYCVDFALANRKLMMDRIIQVFINKGLFNNDFIGLQKTRDSFINIAHNYATMEHHFGINVLVHRKGATSARKGEIGIIPGSQGSKSYIVEGLGNVESFMSCSHGAGRRMGRKQAQRELNFKDEVQKMTDKGIIHSIRTEKDLDEAAGAYKDIDIVMKNQKDLVKILVELTPLAVIKG